MNGKKSKVSGIAATIGAVALMASMAAPAFASSTDWHRNLNPGSAETHITDGKISGYNAGTYSVWLDSIQFGQVYLWAAANNGSRIGAVTILPKNNGGTATTLSYSGKQSHGATVNLRGKAVDPKAYFIYATGRVNFG